MSIAELFFHDANIAWLIADLNKDRLKETWISGKRIVELRARQLIELPIVDDISEFYRSRADYARPANIITIVEQSSIDDELLNRKLGKIVGFAGCQLQGYSGLTNKPVSIHHSDIMRMPFVPSFLNTQAKR